MIATLDDVKAVSAELGYSSGKKYEDAIFISKNGIEYGSSFEENGHGVTFKSVWLYNTEILNLGFLIIGMKPARSAMRRVTLGNTEDLFFIAHQIPSAECPSDKADFAAWLAALHARLVAMAGTVDAVHEEALKAREVIVRERRTYQSGVFEVLSHISILKGDYAAAMRYCDEYYEVGGAHRELGSTIFHRTIAYIERVQNSQGES
jgi:hypothetical protein